MKYFEISYQSFNGVEKENFTVGFFASDYIAEQFFIRYLKSASNVVWVKLLEVEALMRLDFHLRTKDAPEVKIISEKLLLKEEIF